MLLTAVFAIPTSPMIAGNYAFTRLLRAVLVPLFYRVQWRSCAAERLDNPQLTTRAQHPQAFPQYALWIMAPLDHQVAVNQVHTLGNGWAVVASVAAGTPQPPTATNELGRAIKHSLHRTH